jgi:protein-S-isoprenylcysteine O-methyltransferase Ste14
VTARSIIFIAASAGILYLSWRALRTPGSHGFYRFFAWEAILALLLLNAPVWFSDPASIHQLFSWIFLVVSLLLLIPGVLQFLRVGKPTAERQDETLMPFEKTSVLITTGIFGYIRHPLYGSLLFLAWGIALKDLGWMTGGLVAAATILLDRTARADETECLDYFGPAYEEYMKRTKMFIPLIY